jgi:hypothetical protein
VGLLTTAVNRRDSVSDYTGGVDWNLRWKNNSYGFFGQVAASYTGPVLARQDGYAGNFILTKESGWFRWEVHLNILSPEFNPNDLGFIGRVNKLNPFVWLGLRKTQPWGPFHQVSISNQSSATWNFRHKWDVNTYRWVNLGKALRMDVNSQLKNFWRIWVGLAHGFEKMDDLDTRGGPLVVKPAYTHAWIWLQGDDRLRIRPELFFGPTFRQDEGVDYILYTSVWLKPASHIDISLGPQYSWNLNQAQWLTNVDDNKDGRYDHFVYGELKSQTLDLTTRLNVTFTPTLSLQLYMQPFVAVGDYKNFKELARPSSDEFIPYPKLNFNPDFSSRSLRGNMVLRWEYRPGSTLFVVWSQNRSASFDELAFRPLESVRRSFVDEGQNIFLVKLNYWLGI